MENIAGTIQHLRHAGGTGDGHVECDTLWQGKGV